VLDDEGDNPVEKALRAFLERLEAVQEDYDGLGDTDVREHMGDDILRGFLRLESEFVPSGEYGLDPAANRLVANAIARFVKAARAAARREGLDSFHRRLAAFQDLDVRTAGGSDYNDFFGYKEASWFDAAGNDLR
jgi:hypothetical protein